MTSPLPKTLPGGELAPTAERPRCSGSAPFAGIESVRHGPPSVNRWIGATLIWGTVALISVSLAAYRRRPG